MGFLRLYGPHEPQARVVHLLYFRRSANQGARTLSQTPFERLEHLPPGMLVCPDTMHPLRIEGEQAVCPETGRVFAPVDGVPALLPEGFVFTKELEDEDAFYHMHTSEDFTRSHNLAHRNAREPIVQAMDRLGVTAASWCLNVGAGAGGLDGEMVRERTRNMVAIDISPTGLRRFLDREPHAAILATAGKLPFADERFEMVLMSGILHHLVGHDALGRYLDECRRVLKPGGGLVALDPNILYPVGTVMRAADVVMQRVKPGWRGHVPHERHLSPLGVSRIFRRAGFGRVEVLGSSFVHNKFPWFLANGLNRYTRGLAQRSPLRYCTYWFACLGVK